MGVRALIADDDPEFLGLVSHFIEKLGIETVQATSGGDLLHALAEAGPFDVVVTDVAMPWMSGLQVMHSARTAGVRCPVIVMTGHRDKKTLAEVTALGSDVVLVHKPFLIEEMYRALRTCLGTALDASAPTAA